LRTEWREAFLAVPRHLFIPDVMWRSDPDGSRRLVPLRRADDPVTWLKRAYSRSGWVLSTSRRSRSRSALLIMPGRRCRLQASMR
jgi:uncharacterized membrane protein